MRKWIYLLAAALLFNIACARAEDSFYTSNQDLYYHSDAACDIPQSSTWSGSERNIYPREAYKKAPISAEAASAFDKAPCPICVESFEPIYLGEHFPQWPLECKPWGIGDIDPETRMQLMNARPQAYTDEIVATSQAIDAYFEEYYDHETGDVRTRNEYPDWYGGQWSNNAVCPTIALVSPTQDMLAEFKSLFGGGAWIVPAKYSMNQMRSAQDEYFAAVHEWCNDHPEAGAQAVSARSDDVENGVFIGIYGPGWQEAAAAMDKIAPIYVHFYEETALPTWISEHKKLP